MPAGTAPIPLVLTKSLSPDPLPTTFVSPVTMVTSAARAASRIERTIRRRSSMGSPSSRMKPTER